MEVRYLSNIVIVLASLFSTIGFFIYPELWFSTACATLYSLGALIPSFISKANQPTKPFKVLFAVPVFVLIVKAYLHQSL